MSPAVGDLLVTLILGVTLVVVGRWAVRGADRLAPAPMAEEDRHRRARTIRRGGWTCLVVGVLLAIAGALLALR